MKNRKESLTEPTEYSIRIDHYNEQLKSIEKQKKLAELLQQEGLKLLQQINNSELEESAKMLGIANNSINLGINIENKCNEIKADLLLFKPENYD